MLTWKWGTWGFILAVWPKFRSFLGIAKLLELKDNGGKKAG